MSELRRGVPRWAAAAVKPLVAAVIALTSLPAWADPPPDSSARPWLAQAPPPVAVGAQRSGPSSWRIVALVVAMGALGGGAWYLKARRGKAPGPVQTPRLSVVSSVRVGPKAHLVLSSVGSRLILLGVSDASVRKLAWLDDDAGAGTAGAGRDADSDAFGEMLREVVRESGDPAATRARAMRGEVDSLPVERAALARVGALQDARGATANRAGASRAPGTSGAARGSTVVPIRDAAELARNEPAEPSTSIDQQASGLARRARRRA
jgi:flagellar biogenesis protein FliO